MLPCMPTLQGNPLGPNEPVFMRIMCDYVFMHFAPSFLPFLAVHVTRIRESTHGRLDWIGSCFMEEGYVAYGLRYFTVLVHHTPTPTPLSLY